MIKTYWEEKLDKPQTHRRIVLFIVCAALLLDNMLFMVIVPIIPEFLRSIGQWNTSQVTMTTTMIPTTTELPTVNHTSFLYKYNFFYNKAGEDVAVGFLFASKAIVQLLVNPISGWIIDRAGYDRPMLFGLSIMCLSTMMFAFGNTYTILFMARGLQGLGSAFADTSGLAMIADRFPEEKERSSALGIALAFISFGSLIAPPFGGILYQIAESKELPFMILAILALLDGILVVIVMKPVREERKTKTNEGGEPLKPTPIYRLLLDPYIAVCAGCLIAANISLAFLEPTIAIWMKDTLHSEEWQMGLVWFPPFFPHVLGVYTTVKLARAFPRYQWLLGALGLCMEGLSCTMIPFTRAFWVLIIPLSTLCFGIAMVDTSILPTLGYLVDTRHVPIYGSVYAIADISYSIAYAVGPIFAGQIMAEIDFTWLNIIIMLTNIIYAPLMFVLWRVYNYRPMNLDEINENIDAVPKESYVTESVFNKDSNKTYQTCSENGMQMQLNGNYKYDDQKDTRWEGVQGISQDEASKPLNVGYQAQSSNDIDEYAY